MGKQFYLTHGVIETINETKYEKHLKQYFAYYKLYPMYRYYYFIIINYAIIFLVAIHQ